MSSTSVLYMCDDLALLSSLLGECLCSKDSDLWVGIPSLLTPDCCQSTAGFGVSVAIEWLQYQVQLLRLRIY